MAVRVTVVVGSWTWLDLELFRRAEATGEPPAAGSVPALAAGELAEAPDALPGFGLHATWPRSADG